LGRVHFHFFTGKYLLVNNVKLRKTVDQRTEICRAGEQEGKGHKHRPYLREDLMKKSIIVLQYQRESVGN